MDWLNLYGVFLVLLLLIPNILAGIMDRDSMVQRYHNRTAEILEQLGRYGCMLLMAVHFGTRAPGTAYLALGTLIAALYWLGWALLWKERSLRRALVLSVLPTLLFLESGLVTASVPLCLCGVLFGVCHIFISVKSV
ncbi:MAG: hypothetical protein Q4F17_02770 [Eubacteriales bacterium]|nr:hypothetical protein [Eubacteriales bacterium]